MTYQYRRATQSGITVVEHDSELEVWTNYDHSSTESMLLVLFRSGDRSAAWPPGKSVDTISLSPPSPTLLALLRSFAEHRAAYAVVDRLIEEYPEFEPYLAGVTTNATEGVSNGVGATA